MTEIEQKALALVNDVSPYECVNLADANHVTLIKSLRRAIEQHEAFKREVSDAVADAMDDWPVALPLQLFIALENMKRFILPKPDPLVEAWLEAFPGNHIDDAREECAKISASLAKHGFKLERIEHE